MVIHNLHFRKFIVTVKIVPLFKVRNMKKALIHYTAVLDFALKYGDSAEDGVVDLVNGDVQLQLIIYEGDYLFGNVANIWVDEVDELCKKYIDRGLETSVKRNSSVHTRPTHQRFSTRKFYVTDADGNTLRFYTIVNTIRRFPNT